MASALDSKLSSLASGKADHHVLCLPPPRFMGTSEFIAGVDPYDGLSSIPSKWEGGRNTPTLHASQTGISSGLMQLSCRLNLFGLRRAQVTPRDWANSFVPGNLVHFLAYRSTDKDISNTNMALYLANKFSQIYSKQRIFSTLSKSSGGIGTHLA